eukprot:12410593-Alexandrium_andersonii.AAC.1
MRPATGASIPSLARDGAAGPPPVSGLGSSDPSSRPPSSSTEDRPWPAPMLEKDAARLPQRLRRAGTAQLEAEEEAAGPPSPSLF